jgi:hypothetical protein
LLKLKSLLAAAHDLPISRASAIDRSYLPNDPVPVDLPGELHQLVEPERNRLRRSAAASSVASLALRLNAPTESRSAIRGNPENEIASFRVFNMQS